MKPRNLRPNEILVPELARLADMPSANIRGRFKRPDAPRPVRRHPIGGLPVYDRALGPGMAGQLETPSPLLATVTQIMTAPTCQILTGDCRDVLKTLPDESVHCCVTSPPYWGLRDYGVAGQLGLEPTPEAYVEAMVSIFAEVRRVIRKDGTLWLNLGDSYCGPGGGGQGKNGQVANRRAAVEEVRRQQTKRGPRIKSKDLVGIPWLVAFALRNDGWYLRSDIVWSKPNPMPESVTDRPTRSHEYLFLLTKSARYHYEASAISEPATYEGPNGAQHSPYGQGFTRRSQGKQAKVHAATVKGGDRWNGFNESKRGKESLTRNKRSVWTVPTQPFSEAHFATFVHVALAPVVAGQDLYPGDKVILAPDGRAIMPANDDIRPIGVVDPFLPRLVRDGERFWLCLYPKSITSLRHHWQHPAFPDEGRPTSAADATAWIAALAGRMGLSYDALMDYADQYLSDGQPIVQQGQKTWRDYFYGHESTFWRNYEIVTGKKAEDHAAQPFSCSC